MLVHKGVQIHNLQLVQFKKKKRGDVNLELKVLYN